MIGNASGPDEWSWDGPLPGSRAPARRRHTRGALSIGLSLGVVLVLGLGLLLAAAAWAAPSTAAPSTAAISGSGSGWAANTVNQWVGDVAARGLQTTYTATGSAQGRVDFAHGVTDFTVTDLPYQGTDPATGATDEADSRPHAYLPFVGGGVAFAYHLTVDGHRLTGLRLSGTTLARIVTDQIAYWDDPAIEADNNHRVALPHEPVVTVVHGEQSGLTYHLTDLLARQYPDRWTAFSGSAQPTAYFPRQGAQQAANGSDGVLARIDGAAGEGSIGYVEASYAAQADAPVAQLENAAGYYTAPTAGNVAVALTRAVASTDVSPPDTAPDLSGVYTDPDPRSYLLSYYSSLVIPTGANGVETTTASTARRQAVAEFADYGLCQGQGEVAVLGNAPLPLNLVRAGIGQLSRLAAVDPSVDLRGLDLANCTGNPTFTAGERPTSILGGYAPEPAGCDRNGDGPCTIAPDPTAFSDQPKVRIGFGATFLMVARLEDVSTTTALGQMDVVLWSRLATGGPWSRGSTYRTDPSGQVSVRVRPHDSTVYRFRYAGATDHAPAVSSARPVYVGQVVTIHSATTGPRHGTTVTISGAVAPARNGAVVQLQRRTAGRWHTIGATRQQHQRLPDGSTAVLFRFGLRHAYRGDVIVRVHAVGTAWNASGSSVPKTITFI